MPSPSTGRTLGLHLNTLEAREVPAALADAFDASAVHYAPAGWQQWSNNNSQYYQVTKSAAVSGPQSVAVYGNANVVSRLWKAESQSANIAVSLSIRGDTPAPILLFARGTNINSGTPSFVGVSVNTGGVISLRETLNGSDRVLKTIAPSTAVNAAWLKVTLDVNGTTGKVSVQRLDTHQYLNSNSTWQSSATDAITQAVTWNPPAGGVTGLGRLSGNYGTAFVDNFTATPSLIASTPTPTPAPTPTPTPTPAPSPMPTTDSRKFDHIRITQLAYSGLKITEVEKSLLAGTTDLVIANPNHLATLETASPTTPKLVYSNVSNIYLDLLSDWLGHADAIATNPEAAFYHVTQPTAFTGSSASAQPVNWFWSAVKQTASKTTDITSSIRNSTAGVSVGLTGESFALGGVDKFREVNVSLNKTAGAGFSGVWEYASAIDASGKITAWKSLPTVSDTTNGFKVNGRMTFNPPSDWKRGTLAGNDNDYFIRFRVTAGTAATTPLAKSILGRDYVNANGANAGVIPAFDSNADTNGDGYLTDAEYATRKAGSDARFVSESRLFYPYYGQMRFVVNPTSAAVKAWAADYHEDWLDGIAHADGIFLDNSNGKLPFAGTAVKESVANYSADSAALVAAVKTALDENLVIANTTGTRAEANPVTKAAGIAFEEFALRPTTVTWQGLLDQADIVQQRLASDPKSELILDSHPGTTAMTDARTRLGVLSYYYLVGDPERTYLTFFGGFAPSASWQQRWVPAAAVDVGQPQGAPSVFASGADPEKLILQYRVYGRKYDNALVLFKPLSYQLGQGTGTTSNATATTHPLNGNYRVLNADGTRGQVITTITLRNGEGAVLMKA